MNSYKCFRAGFIIFTILTAGCTTSDEPEVSAGRELPIPEPIKNFENLTVFSPDSATPDTVELLEEAVFESHDDVYLDGYISEVAVDDRDRVFIAATKPGSVGVYVFNPDGSFLTRFAREGKGPGEYESIASITISGQYLYLLDPRLQKFGIFSLEDFSHIRDEILIRDKIGNDTDFSSMMTGRELFVRTNSTLFMTFGSRMIHEGFRKILLYQLSEEGVILPGKILELKSFRFYHPELRETSDGIVMPFTMPFSRSSLLAVSGEGSFFTAWTEDFLIHAHDEEGNIERSFYYPLKKPDLRLSELEINDIRRRELEKDTVPETWPALHTMEVDDEGRLWVATITGSKNSFRWWVLNQDGEPLARFTLPGDRASNPVMTKPLIFIKNDYFYTLERDFNAGIDRVVKHRAVFLDRSEI